MVSPCMHEDLTIQVLQERTHLVTEEGRAQQAEEWAEDNTVISRLVSAASPSEFRAATGTPPRQYAICRWQKSCD